ncbi:MAG: hypothetical protein ACE5GJ_12380 [Gemmatimonadota bacterium]
MSRAFVKEDADGPRGPEYRLPDPDSPFFDEAAAWALLSGADEGDTRGAELATGCRWGEPRLVPHVEAILEQARREDNTRLEQLARRFLRASRHLD